MGAGRWSQASRLQPHPRQWTIPSKAIALPCITYVLWDTPPPFDRRRTCS